MDQYIGRLLDNRYEILEIIGTGGMAVVYKARCHRLNRLVAIKILKDEFSRDDEFRRRFRAEGEAVAMLSHSNIVQVFDVSSSDSANYIVMELIDGISLKQYMEAKGVLNWPWQPFLMLDPCPLVATVIGHCLLRGHSPHCPSCVPPASFHYLLSPPQGSQWPFRALSRSPWQPAAPQTPRGTRQAPPGLL